MKVGTGLVQAWSVKEETSVWSARDGGCMGKSDSGKPGIIDRPMVRRKVFPESRWSQLLSCDKRQSGVRRTMATERKTAACTTSACMLKLQQEKHKVKKERRRRKEKRQEKRKLEDNPPQ